MPIPIALLAAVGAGIAQTAIGASQKRKAQREAAANVMPQYQIPQEEYDALRLAESRAGMGMSAGAREALRSDTDRAQGTYIDAILRGGGNVNAIGNVAARTQEQLNKNAIYEDQARLENLRALQAQRARMSASRDKAYQVNEYAPWANRAQANAQQLNASQNMMMSGINTLGSGALGLLSNISGMNAGKMPSYGYVPPAPQIPSMPMPTGAYGEPSGMYQPSMVSIPPAMGYQQPQMESPYPNAWAQTQF